MNTDKEKSGTFTGSDNVQIFYRYCAAQPERARMVIAHGLGEHSGRYGNLVSLLIGAGVSAWVPDHRGHGRSGGKRGHVLHFMQYVTDLRMMIDRARQDMPTGMPCFLFGHSLGGLIALYCAQQFSDRVDGLVISSPALGMVIEVPAVKKIAGRVMSSVYPGLSMGNELDAAKISHDPEVVRAYENDPLVHDRVSARFFTEFMAAMQTVNQNAAAIKAPLLLQLAGDDHLVNAQASRRFFENLQLKDKTLHVYDGLYHEIYNETEAERRRVLKDLSTWLEAHIGQGGQ